MPRERGQMAIRKIDQAYTLIDITVSEFDDTVIKMLMGKHSSLASARSSKTKFGGEDNNSLKFFVHHRSCDVNAVITDIETVFAGNTMTKRVYK